MQATVKVFDPATATGSVVTDQGDVLPYDAAAFATSQLRLLRPGQRLTITTSADARSVQTMRLGSIASHTAASYT